LRIELISDFRDGESALFIGMREQALYLILTVDLGLVG